MPSDTGCNSHTPPVVSHLRDLAVHDRMPNRQHVMGDRQTRACQALGQEDAITRGSAAVLLTVDDQDRRAIQAGGQFISERRERPE